MSCGRPKMVLKGCFRLRTPSPLFCQHTTAKKFSPPLVNKPKCDAFAAWCQHTQTRRLRRLAPTHSNAMATPLGANIPLPKNFRHVVPTHRCQKTFAAWCQHAAANKPSPFGANTLLPKIAPLGADTLPKTLTTWCQHLPNATPSPLGANMPASGAPLDQRFHCVIKIQSRLQLSGPAHSS